MNIAGFSSATRHRGKCLSCHLSLKPLPHISYNPQGDPGKNWSLQFVAEEWKRRLNHFPWVRSWCMWSSDADLSSTNLCVASQCNASSFCTLLCLWFVFPLLASAGIPGLHTLQIFYSIFYFMPWVGHGAIKRVKCPRDKRFPRV